MTLSVLAALYSDSLLRGFEIFGVVKETGADDEGLADFYSSYFGRAPLYCDKSFSYYQALGDRKASDVPSIWTLVTSFLDAWKRIQGKGINFNFKGEGLIKGGIIIFDTKGKPQYAYREETGIDLPVKELVLALEAMRRRSAGEDSRHVYE